MLTTDSIFDAVKDTQQAAKELRSQLNDARLAFSKRKTYPELTNLVMVHADVKQVNENRDELAGVVNLQAGALSSPILRELLTDEEITPEILFQQFSNVLSFANWAEGKIFTCMQIGRQLHENASEQIIFNWDSLEKIARYGMLVVDTSPIAALSSQAAKEPRVYTYRHQARIVKESRYWVLHTEFRGTISAGSQKHLTNAALEQLQADDHDSHADSIVIASVIEPFPFKETLFPVIRRQLLSKFVNQQKQET